VKKLNNLKVDTYLDLWSRILLRQLVEVYIEGSVVVASVEIVEIKEGIHIRDGLLVLRDPVDMVRVGRAGKSCWLMVRLHPERRVRQGSGRVGVGVVLVRHRNVQPDW